jgi:hypothetical protein
MKYSVSLDPNTVIEHVVDMDMWQDRIWVNHQQRLYFIPIWRNANTQFMQLAKQFGFTLDYQPDVTDYTGFVFVRHPYNRIAGQYWRAMVNRNWTLDLITEKMRSGYVDDPHFNTQNSFITPWPQPDYFINLDDIQKTGHGQIDNIINQVQKQQSKKISALGNESIIDRIISSIEIQNLVQNYFAEDFNMFLNRFSDKHKLMDKI